MSDTKRVRAPAAEAAELAGLVRGREPDEVVARLRGVSEALADGRESPRADLDLLDDIRARYGHELHELENPEE